MEIRYFQIIIPLLTLGFIVSEFLDYRKSASTFYKMVISIVFWILVAIFSIFPDFFSELIARVFGIKDNINAIIFFALGLVFYFQIQLFGMIKKQEENLTQLTRKMALKYPNEKL